MTPSLINRPFVGLGVGKPTENEAFSQPWIRRDEGKALVAVKTYRNNNCWQFHRHWGPNCDCHCGSSSMGILFEAVPALLFITQFHAHSQFNCHNKIRFLQRRWYLATIAYKACVQRPELYSRIKCLDLMGISEGSTRGVLNSLAASAGKLNPSRDLTLQTSVILKLNRSECNL